MGKLQHRQYIFQRLGLIAICLALVACGSTNISTPLVTTVTSQSQYVSTVPVENQQQSTQASTDASICESKNWNIVPINYYRYPQGNGWDIILVDLAVTNNSKYWGSVSMRADDFTVTTEDGFTYTPFQGAYENVPQNPKSPYSGTIYIQYAVISSNILPPGFTMIGLMGSGISSGEISRFTFGFKVASTQQHLVLNISNANVLCVNPSIENPSETIPDTSEALENLSLPILPTNRPAIDFQNIADLLIQIPNLGTIKYNNISKGTDGLEFNFTFANANQGYEETGSILQSYIIGDDGITRTDDCSVAMTSCYNQGGYDAGPGQTVNVLPMPFRRPGILTHNIKFVLIDPAKNLYQVFNVEELETNVNNLDIADQATGLLTINTAFGDVTIEKMKGLYTEKDIPSCKDFASYCDEYFKNNRGFWAYKITIPTVHDLSMGEENYGGSNFPDRFFSSLTKGMDITPSCFFESRDTDYEMGIWQSTNPAMMYCEARDNAFLEFNFSISILGDSTTTSFDFKLRLDPSTGMLTIEK